MCRLPTNPDSAPGLACDAWIDDDDWVLPGAMAQCIRYLDEHPRHVGVYTDREALYPDGRRQRQHAGPWTAIAQLARPGLITHLKLMRRGAVLPRLEELRRWPTYEEYVLCGLLAAQGPWGHLPVAGAVKRVLPAEQSSERLATPGLLQVAARKIAPILAMQRL